MKTLILTREQSSKSETMGLLTVNGVSLHTIERPWIPSHPGGKPFSSCVPAGTYKLVPHTRSNGDQVVALVNPGMAVYYQSSDRPTDAGRYLILIHSGNWSTDVVGCIAPGVDRATSAQGVMVTKSRVAMRLIMEYIAGDPAEIEIVGSNGYEVMQ